VKEEELINDKMFKALGRDESTEGFKSPVQGKRTHILQLE
jgi:hypothetical protein